MVFEDLLELAPACRMAAHCLNQEPGGLVVGFYYVKYFSVLYRNRCAGFGCVHCVDVVFAFLDFRRKRNIARCVLLVFSVIRNSGNRAAEQRGRVHDHDAPGRSGCFGFFRAAPGGSNGNEQEAEYCPV